MENLIIYLAKASGLVALFYIAYQALLRKETFFNTNRKFLVIGLVSAVILPLMVLTRTVWVEAAPKVDTQPISAEQLAILQQYASTQNNEVAQTNWYDVGAGIYLAGVLFFAVRFIIDILSLRNIIKGQAVIKQNSYRLIDSDKVQAPFSFFNYIVFNSKILSEQELESIIAHEKVHSSQKHSIDMILSQLFCIAFWFNPIVWMYRKSISQNLEFIADAEATKQIADKTAYQKTLLKITARPECIAITNHFYQSLIKKRIVMLNKKQSRRMNSWKYATVLPALLAFMFFFQLKVTAQEKETEITSNYTEKVKVALEVNKDSKNKELESEKEFFKKEFDTDVKFENINRNAKGEITAIKVTLKDKTQNSVYEVSGTEPIAPFTVEIERNSSSAKNSFSFGSPKKGYTINNFPNTPTDTTGTKTYMFVNGNIPVPPAPPVPPAGTAPQAPPAPAVIAPVKRHWSVSSWKYGDEDALIIINGVKQKKGEPLKLPLNEEIKEATILTKKEGRKKYGKDGKNGAVEIITSRVAAVYGTGNINYGIAIPQMDPYKRMAELKSYQADYPRLEKLLNSDYQIAMSSFNSDDIKELLANTEETLNRLKISPEIYMLEVMDEAELQKAREEIAKMKENMAARKSQLIAEREKIRAEREKMMEERKKQMEERKKEFEKNKGNQ
ncbi:M56 family metallopeptidase [Flavobacterium sp. MK4S-17]|uniref:M56 family metallopeptidase n=1 Tax=Flavobacterium sp. MK4S-17 TaxID=2543737 RepID=UPI00135BC7BC|nr:M56 family metallopeptidase [Flavobacterium sp. MK4S-17]